MKNIYKYVLDGGSTWIALPEGSVVLTAQLQKNTPTLWVMVNLDATRVKQREFGVFVTGGRFSMNVSYIATMQREDGIVLHVMEILP
jgi:hypothetical protein